MTDLDDLRRVAYGRTSSAAEEAAAVDARAALAEHDARSLQVRAEREAAEFARARAIEHEAPSEGTTDAASGSEPQGRVTVDIVEVYDEPGYLHRLAATWRVWAVPAFAAFVVGVALTLASGLLVLNAGTRGDDRENLADAGETMDPSLPHAGTLSLAPGGDLEAATAQLAASRSADDTVMNLDAEIDPSTTQLLRSMPTATAYGAMDLDGKICLVVVWSDDGSAPWVCTVPSEFPGSGLTMTRVDEKEAVMLHWDGVRVSETRTPQ